MSTLESLRKALAQAQGNHASEEARIESEIYECLKAQWDDWKYLQDTLTRLENFERVEYVAKEDGIYTWLRFDGIEKQDREFFATYLQDRCVYYNFADGCLEQFCGDDSYIVQDDTRSDNGVWVSHKLVIKESDYREYGQDVNTDLRNQLIERHMEKSGCFPGTFYVSRNGDVTPINTQEKGRDFWFQMIDASGYSLAVELPEDCVEECSASGSVDRAVASWMDQLCFDAPIEGTKAYLKTFGAWNETELGDHEANRARLLWSVCCDLRESDEE